MTNNLVKMQINQFPKLDLDLQNLTKTRLSQVIKSIVQNPKQMQANKYFMATTITTNLDFHLAKHLLTKNFRVNLKMMITNQINLIL